MFSLIFITLIKNKNSCLNLIIIKIRLITLLLYFSEVTFMTYYAYIINCSLNADKINNLQAYTYEDYFSQALMLLMTSDDIIVKLLLLLSDCLNILKVYYIIMRLTESQKLDLVWQSQIFVLLTLYYMYVQTSLYI